MYNLCWATTLKPGLDLFTIDVLWCHDIYITRTVNIGYDYGPWPMLRFQKLVKDENEKSNPLAAKKQA